MTKQNTNPQKIPTEELIENLRTYANTIGETPSAHKMNTDGPHSSRTYKKRFGSWNNALEAAELTHNRKGSTTQPAPQRKKTLLKNLETLARDLNRIPTQKEIREHTPHSHNTYYDHWGGIEQALHETSINLTEIDTTQRTNPQKIPTEELLEDLRRLTQKLERPPRWVDIREHGKYSDTPYRTRFENLEEAIETAGIPLDY